MSNEHTMGKLGNLLSKLITVKSLNTHRQLQGTQMIKGLLYNAYTCTYVQCVYL